MKIVKGWKRISNKGGFVNEVTGQTLIVAKQEFGEHYHVLLFKQERTDDCQGKKYLQSIPMKRKLKLTL